MTTKTRSVSKKALKSDISRVAPDSNGWDSAIEEGQRQLRVLELRALRLRKVIADFTGLRDSGMPWPKGQSGKQIK